MEFVLKVQPEVFQIKPTVETVPAKKNMKIIVSTSYIKSDSVNNKPIPFTGKVTIKCTKSNIPNLKWVYYLQTEYNRNI